MTTATATTRADQRSRRVPHHDAPQPPPPRGEGRGEGLAGSARSVAHDSCDLATSRSGDLALPTDQLNRLLTAYLNPLLRFEEAAESLNLTLLDFIARLNHPDVERALATIAAAKARRAEHLALCAHDSAVAALIRIIDSDKATGPVRAAAASLLRRIRESTSTASPKPPPPRGEGWGEGLGNPKRTSRGSPDRATDSEDAAAEKSVRPSSHPNPQTPDPKPASQSASDESTTAHARPSAGVPP